MICDNCGNDILAPPCACGWRPPLPKRMAITEQKPEGISKEQFGLALYEAIKLCGGLLQVRHYLSLQLDEDTGQIPHFLGVDRHLTKKLRAMMPNLTFGQQRELVDHYPTLFNQTHVLTIQDIDDPLSETCDAPWFKIPGRTKDEDLWASITPPDKRFDWAKNPPRDA